MAFEFQPRDVTDVFLLSSAISLTNLREMKAHACYTVARCMPGGRLWLVDTLELLPSDWLNLEPLALDTPQTDALDWIRSYYSAVRVAILLSGPCRTVMSINNADVIKLLRSDRSSDTRALLFYFIIIIILFYFILFYFILFYFIFVKLLNTSHCSPPPSSLSPPQPALFAEVRTLPIFQHFSSKSLSFNMTDLGGKYSDSTDFSKFFFRFPIF